MDNPAPSMLIQNKALAFTAFPIYEEYLRQPTQLCMRLRQRAGEVRLSADDQSYFSTYPDFLHFVALISEETPDSWIVPPIWARIAQASPRFSLRIATDTENLSALAFLLDESNMPAFLEELVLPALFVFDEEWNLQAQWGPHPQNFFTILDSWLAEYPEYERLTESDDPADIAAYTILAEQLAGEMRVWYNDSLNRECAGEIRLLLARLTEESAETEPGSEGGADIESADDDSVADNGSDAGAEDNGEDDTSEENEL